MEVHKQKQDLRGEKKKKKKRLLDSMLDDLNFLYQAIEQTSYRAWRASREGIEDYSEVWKIRLLRKQNKRIKTGLKQRKD